MKKIRTEGIVKTYPGTVALDHVSLEFVSGKVNALIGKNGSGKSTLIKIFSGAIKPSEGKFYLDDTELVFNDPRDSAKAGIATVYQELSLIPGLTVAENIYMGNIPMIGKFVDWKSAFRNTQALLDEYGIDINPQILVANLSMWQCQMVEILKVGFSSKIEIKKSFTIVKLFSL